MTQHMDNHDMRELLLPYALGQLDAVEQRRVERALEADPELRRDLEALEAVGARIVSGVEMTPAPPALKGRVMDAVRGVVDRPDAQAPAAADAPDRREARAARPGARRRRFVMPAFVGGLAAACLVLAVVAVDLSRSLEEAERRAQQVEPRSEGIRAAGFEGAEPFKVATTQQFDQASGSLVRVARDKWILLFNDVPSPGVGRSWQVWTVNSRGMVENVAQWKSGSTQLLALERADIVQVMVSHEPTTRPVPVPSSEPVADVRV